MSIRAFCSACGKHYNLADDLQGKMVKCKECGQTFVAGADEEVLNPVVLDDEPSSNRAQASSLEHREGVQAKEPFLPPPVRSRKRREDDDDEPRRRRARFEDDEDDDRPRRRHGRHDNGTGNVVWVLVGVTAGVIALVVLIVVLWNAGSNEPPVVIAEVNPPQPFNPNPNPFNPNPNPNPFNLNPDPFNPKPINPKRPVNALPPVEPLLGPVQWTVQPDPGPDMSKPPLNPKAFALLLGNPHIDYPSTPSHFVAIKHGQGKQGWQVFNLLTFQPVAVLNVAPDITDEILSPDGKLLAGKGRFQFNAPFSIHVVALDKSQIIQSIPIDRAGANVGMIDFLENGHLLIFQTKGLTGHFQVFNIQTGVEIKHFTVEGLLNRKDHFALSPGRKYLAVGHKDKVSIYQPLTGAVVGELRLPIGNGQFKGLAFSPDGQELACHLDHFGATSRLICWKMTNGAQAMHHHFVKALHSQVQNAFAYQGNSVMEWVPDRSGLLFYGQLLVDYKSGAPVYKIPVDPKDFRHFPRRLIGNDHVVIAGGDFRTTQIGIVPLPKDEILANATKARTDAAAPVDNLPAARPPDLAGARSLPPPNGIVPWKAALDPAPNPKGPLGARAIVLRSKADDIQQIAFAQGDVGLAAVLERSAPNPLSPIKRFRVDRYDLVTGKSLGGCDLFGGDPKENNPTAKAELSPDGSRLAVRRSGDEKRLDLWNLAEGKHLAGWEPHGFSKVDWFAFVDADRLLTAGANGKLILWQVPECKALYVVDGYRGPLEFSPGRKYALGLAGVGLELIEAATGERAGQLESPGGPVGALQTAAFSRDGIELVAAIISPGGTKLARWKLTDGTFTGSMNTNHGNQAMMWISPRHVMHGTTLYDWNLKGGIWTYTLPGPGHVAAGSPDGRVWYAYSFGANPVTILASQVIPDASAQTLADLIAAGAAQPAIPPGTPVQLSINSGNDKFRADTHAALEKKLQELGFKLGPGALNIAISAQESGTGQTISYRFIRLGPGKGPPRGIIKIQEKQVACQAVITDAQGVTLLKLDSNFRTPVNMTFKGDDYENQLRDAMWNHAINWGRSVALPTNMYRIGGQLHALPKLGRLTAGG